MKNKLLLGLCIVFMLFALQVVAVNTHGNVGEANSISRMVGNDPYDIINQLDTKQINLHHATQLASRLPFLEDFTSNKMISEGFPGNYNIKGEIPDGSRFMYYWLGSFDPWTGGYNSIDTQLSQFKPNELFILESYMDPDDFGIYANKLTKSDKIFPKDVGSWKQTFSETNPLFFMNIEGAGLALPDKPNYVSELTRYSTLIAPKDVRSAEFVTSILCNLYDNERIGDLYLRSRNSYYTNTDPSDQNMPGLVLKSYSLYGNPLTRIDVPDEYEEYIDSMGLRWRDRLFEMDWWFNPCKKYFVPPADFGAQTFGIQSLQDLSFDNAESFDYEVIPVENTSFKIINSTTLIPNFDNNNVLGLYTIREHRVPKGSIVENITSSLSDPVYLDIPEYPSVFDDNLTERNCFDIYENESVSMRVFEEDYYDEIVVTINPLKINDCENGSFVFYQNLSYSIDYIPFSPFYFDNLSYDKVKSTEEIIDLSFDLVYISPESVNGTIIITKDNDTLYQKEITSRLNNYNLSFLGSDNEELSEYKLKYIEGGIVRTEATFYVETRTIDAAIIVGEFISNSAIIQFNVSSYFNNDTLALIKAELIDGPDSSLLFDSNVILTEGVNSFSFIASGLLETQSNYGIKVYVDIANERKTFTDVIITNHEPIIRAEDIYVRVGQEVVYDYEIYDLDNDTITASITGGNPMPWIADVSDIGTTSVEILADDGLLQSESIFNVIVIEENYPPILFDHEDVYIIEGEVASVLFYARDLDFDNLTYGISNDNFSKIDYNWFEWYTYYGDEGVYNITYSVSDGIFNVSNSFWLTIGPGPDLCINVTCGDICDNFSNTKFMNGTCNLGLCSYTDIIENATECGFIPPNNTIINGCNFSLDVGGRLSSLIFNGSGTYSDIHKSIVNNSNVDHSSIWNSTLVNVDVNYSTIINTIIHNASLIDAYVYRGALVNGSCYDGKGNLPDLCANVTCNDYCDNSTFTKYEVGTCNQGNCSYANVIENATECGYTAPITCNLSCENKCEGHTYYSNGSCSLEVAFRTNAVNGAYVDNTWIAMNTYGDGDLESFGYGGVGGIYAGPCENYPTNGIYNITIPAGDMLVHPINVYSSVEVPYDYVGGYCVAHLYCEAGDTMWCFSNTSEALLAETSLLPTEPYASNSQEVYRQNCQYEVIEENSTTCGYIPIPENDINLTVNGSFIDDAWCGQSIAAPYVIDNYGANTESVRVEYWIDGVLDQTITQSVPAGGQIGATYSNCVCYTYDKCIGSVNMTIKLYNVTSNESYDSELISYNLMGQTDGSPCDNASQCQSDYCNAGTCSSTPPDLCANVTCNDHCEGYTWNYGGTCSAGICIYNEEYQSQSCGFNQSDYCMVMDQESLYEGSYGCVTLDNPVWGQTFVTGNVSTMMGVGVRFQNTYDNITFHLYDSPSKDTIILQKFIDQVSAENGNILFDELINISPATQYYFEVFGAACIYNAGVDGSNPYPFGNEYFGSCLPSEYETCSMSSQVWDMTFNTWDVKFGSDCPDLNESGGSYCTSNLECESDECINNECTDLCANVTCDSYCDFTTNTRYEGGSCSLGECSYSDVYHNVTMCGFTPSPDCSVVYRTNVENNTYSTDSWLVFMSPYLQELGSYRWSMTLDPVGCPTCINTRYRTYEGHAIWIQESGNDYPNVYLTDDGCDLSDPSGCTTHMFYHNTFVPADFTPTPIEPYLSNNQEAYNCTSIPPDLCANVTCDDQCDANYTSFRNGTCNMGNCEYAVVENNSAACGFDPICYDETDCGIDSFFGDLFCSADNVTQLFTDYTCENPGTMDSVCSDSNITIVNESCTFGCTLGACNADPCLNVTCDDYCGGFDNLTLFSAGSCSLGNCTYSVIEDNSTVCGYCGPDQDCDGDGLIGLYDCDDSNASIVAPYDGLVVNGSIKLCAGTYYLNDSDGDGSIITIDSGSTLDCNGAVMTGSGVETGISVKGIMDWEKLQADTDNFSINPGDLDIVLDYMDQFIFNSTLVTDVTIENCIMENFDTAIDVEAGRYIDVKNNIINDSGVGIKGFLAVESQFNNNLINGGELGIFMLGYNSDLMSNNVSGANKGSTIIAGLELSGNCMVAGLRNMTIGGNIASSCDENGIVAAGDVNHIINDYAMGNKAGIVLIGSRSSDVSGSKAAVNDNGLLLLWSERAIIYNNDFEFNNNRGINILHSSDNHIFDNLLRLNKVGLAIGGFIGEGLSEGNIIENNNASDNSLAGMGMTDGTLVSFIETKMSGRKSGGHSVLNSTFKNNYLDNPGAYDFYPYHAASASFAGNEVYSNDMYGWGVAYGAEDEISYCVNDTGNNYFNTATGPECPSCYFNEGCGTDGVIAGPFCIGDDIAQTNQSFTCNEAGQYNASCSSDIFNITLETCQFGCDEGICNPDPCLNVTCDDYCAGSENFTLYTGGTCNMGSCEYGVIENNSAVCGFNPICYDETDCGIDSFIGDLFCTADNVTQLFTDFTCENPGTMDSICSQDNITTVNETCTFGCTLGICNQDPCLNVTCNDYCDNSTHTKYELGSCSLGMCDYGNVIENSTECGYVEPECYIDEDCNHLDNISSDYCIDNNVYNNITDGVCVNPGIQSAYCEAVGSSQYIQDCYYGCFDGSCNPDPCEGITCSDYCGDIDNFTSYRQGSCEPKVVFRTNAINNVFENHTWIAVDAQDDGSLEGYGYYNTGSLGYCGGAAACGWTDVLSLIDARILWAHYVLPIDLCLEYLQGNDEACLSYKTTEPEAALAELSDSRIESYAIKNQEIYDYQCNYDIIEPESAVCGFDPACYAESDCQSNITDYYCVGDDRYLNLTSYSCVDPGTMSSYCEPSSQQSVVETCQFGCNAGACEGDPCEGVICDDKCDNETNTRYESGTCNMGLCEYNIIAGNSSLCGFIDLDLYIESGNVMTPNPVINQPTVFQYGIRNQGSIDINNLYFMLDTGSSDKNPTSMDPVSVSAGQLKYVMIWANYSQPGNYSTILAIDHEDIIQENNEFNNDYSVDVQVN